jgi:NAD(P)-dependent dehydrogenase (short-subunit alcohol dehydrogenase family)
MQLFDLTGQKILIIGGGSRMGLAVAKILSVAFETVN